MQYVNLANRSPCDVIKKMADFQEDGDRKLQIFAYLHVGVTTLSIPIGLYLWYCFFYRNKNFACQWHFNVLLPSLSFLVSMFFGMKPFLIISDVDLLKDITVKHFDKFVNRSVSEYLNC